MKLIKFFSAKKKPHPKAVLPVRSVTGVLFAAATVYISMFIGLGLPIAAVLAAAEAFLVIRFDLCGKALCMPLIFHIISLCISAYTAFSLYSYFEGSLVSRAFAAASAVYLVYFITAILFSVLSDKQTDEAPEKGRFLKAAAAFMPLLITVVVYIPSETYFNNRKDYLHVFFDFAPYILIKTVVFTLIAGFTACALNRRLFRILSSLLIGLTLCVYCQYVFMNGDLPSTVGTEIDWDKLRGKMILNAVIWVVLLTLPLIYMLVSSRIRVLKNSSAAANVPYVLCAFIGGIQLLSLIMLIFTTNGTLVSHERYVLLDDEQFTVSGKKNIITFIIDAGDSDYFEAEAEEHPEKFEFLKDFTYYNNACMMYDSTNLSIPQMLSGSTKAPEDNVYEWYENIWSTDTCREFYSRLHENNYKANVFGIFSYTYAPLNGIIDNCAYAHEETVEVDKLSLNKVMNKWSAFRYMPLIFKKSYEPVPNEDGNIVRMPICNITNDYFCDSLDLKISDSDQNYFIVEHTEGTHSSAGRVKPTREITLKILNKYIDQLKGLGVYDDAVIIITADHGEHVKPDNMPIWYIKPAYAHNEKMQTCSAPIHHTDYLATCLEALGLYREGDSELFGRSIFDIDENEQRERLVFQREEFPYVGKLDWKKWSDSFHPGALYGYYFTGTKKELAEHEKTSPPDILIELDSSY